MSKTQDKFPRQTFLQVLNAQENIRKTLKKWSENNRTPNSKEEIKFHKQISKATLGLCQNISFKKIHPAWQKTTLSKVINIALTSPSEKIKVGSSNQANYEKKEYQIGVFWNKILERLNEAVFDRAINLAIKISPEKAPPEDNLPY